MNNLVKILVIIILQIISLSSFSQKLNPEGMAKHYFFVKLANGEGSNLIRYGVIDVNKRGGTTLHYLNRENFMYEFTGNRPSKANPDTVDFMQKYEISYQAIKTLWKIKYSENPWHQKYANDYIGWAGRAQAPSIRQMKYLKKYGINKFITEPIYGDSLIKLLQDVQDESWRTEYMNLK